MPIAEEGILGKRVLPTECRESADLPERIRALSRARLGTVVSQRGKQARVFESIPSFCSKLTPVQCAPRLVARLKYRVWAPYTTSLLFP